MSENHAKMIDEMRLLLQRRRREVQEATRGAARELSALKAQERDPEYEENAQSELADYTLSQLIEQQRRALELIDAAFRRMDAGTFGECIDCGQQISRERLEVLPYAIRCEEDAQLYEQERRMGQGASPSL